jgi:hypothetical protein
MAQPTPMLAVDRDRVLAFRLDGHNLSRRLPPGSLTRAAAACGIRNAPPWAAPLSFLARVEGITEDDLDRAIATDRTLVQVWSMRVSPFFVPADDLPVFTTALLPRDEAAARWMVPKLLPRLDAAGISAKAAMERIAAAAASVLDGRELGKSDLQDGIEERVALDIWPWCDKCKLRHISDAQLHPIGWAGVCCFGPRVSNAPRFVRTDQWLGRPLPAHTGRARDTARAELVRRYLRCYGPSDAAAFAEWAGVPPSEARHGWQVVEPEMAAVTVGGRRLSVLADDLPRLEAPPASSGARLLPPNDPYLLLRDRDLLLPDRAARDVIWRTSGALGAALVRGSVIGTWRMQTRRGRLAVVVDVLTDLSREDRTALEVEASVVAGFRGCAAYDVSFQPTSG